MKSRILYISYDGMLEPLGQSQVLSYLERLTDTADISLISFEKPEDWADKAKRVAATQRIAAAGIRWTPLRYHRNPSAPATAYDIAAGTAAAVAIALRRRIGIVHARSYVAALMGLGVKRTTGARLLFDMRGFWADERVDAGLWPANGRLYRSAKAIEQRLLKAADHVVTLTHASRDEMGGFAYLQDRSPPMTVIPTCADLGKFAPGARPSGPFTLGFVGAASNWSLFDQVLAGFRLLREEEPDARLLVVNHNEHDFIRARIAAAAIDGQAVEIVAAEHGGVAPWIRRMHAGTALRRATYSQLACAPTKLAEYLGCGVPCLSNEGIGDVTDILTKTRVGVVVPEFGEDAMRKGVRNLVALAREDGVADRCVRAAHMHFSLDDGVEAYRGIYRALGSARARG